jgi:hypothetical protein
MGDLVLIVGVLAAVLVVGLVANRWVRPFAKNEVQGVKLELLISPLLTLTVLLLTFVLVQVFTGYRASKDAAALEAGRAAYMFEIAGYYDDDVAQPMQESLVCYARAVAYQEWDDLAKDPPRFNQIAGDWGSSLDTPLAALRTEADGQPYGALLGADKERADARRLRFVQARPALPTEVSLLLLGTSALAIGAIAAFTLPYVSRRTQIGALIVLTMVLGAVQLTIVDMDAKYTGFIEVDNRDFVLTDELLTERFEQRYPDQQLPCDAVGSPTG